MIKVLRVDITTLAFDAIVAGFSEIICCFSEAGRLLTASGRGRGSKFG